MKKLFFRDISGKLISFDAVETMYSNLGCYYVTCFNNSKAFEIDKNTYEELLKEMVYILGEE